MDYDWLLKLNVAIYVAMLVFWRFSIRLCPHCRGRMPKAASVCRHCGRDVK